jgi:hypothetical protein
MHPMNRGVALATLFAALLLGSAAARADAVLWYNGDPNGASEAGNGLQPSSDLMIFDDFNVTDPAGWVIQRVWSIDAIFGSDAVTQAHWEIRSGVSAGNGGTLIASGTTAATQTAVGRMGIIGPMYTIEVDGLNVHLGPGTYWLAVVPELLSDSDFSSIQMTRGPGAVGTPAGDDLQAFIYSASRGYNFSDEGQDFSMGVAGVVDAAVTVPEPTTLMLVGLSLASLVAAPKVKARA